jgi:hypothetical protein
MNYQKHYNLLIERAKYRVLKSYTEKHHIIPECIGGSNAKDNLVRLTPEEHYVAHQLLVKMYPDNAKLIFAAHMLNKGRNNKLYGWIRKKHANKISEMNIGKIGNRNGKKQTDKCKALIRFNNPRRKSIMTPFGEYISSEDFANKHKNVTSNGLRNILKEPDKVITKNRQSLSNLFKPEDIGKTPREIGWYFL